MEHNEQEMIVVYDWRIQTYPRYTSDEFRDENKYCTLTGRTYSWHYGVYMKHPRICDFGRIISADFTTGIVETEKGLYKLNRD